MTEMLERITPDMSEEEVLGVILDEIMARAEPDVAEAIRFCAIPHWFNEEIVAWLRGEGLKPSQRSREILAALTELTFVGPYHERGWAYHENVRDLLLHRWRERDEEFKELSGRAIGYFEQKAEAATGEECEEWERERMYHLLVADEEQGHELFQSMFDEAIKFYRLSTCSLLLQLAGEFREHLSEGHQKWLRYDEGQLAYQSVQWNKALGFFEALLEEELIDELRGKVLDGAGLVYNIKGEWERAIEYYERSLEMVERVGDEQGMATTFNNLGLVYRNKGEWELAIEYYKRNLAITQKIGDEYGVARTLNNLGLVHKASGERERAIEYYERSLEMAEKVGDKHGMAITFNNLGEVYRAKGEWERAIEYYKRSLAITQKIGDEYVVARTLNNLGSVYQAGGEWEQAVEYYGRSLAIKEKVGDERGRAFSYNNIARLCQDQGRLEEAIPLFEKSLEIFERTGDEPSAGTVRGNLERAKQALEAKKGQE